MTTRTDLTENRDFGAPFEIQVNRIIAEETLELANERMMSSEEFEKIYAWEKKFGRKYHYTEGREIFRKSDDEWRMEMNDHCQRCGKEFRMPWKKVFDLCEECNKIFLGRMPWKDGVIPVGDNHSAMEIFSLR